MGPLIAWAVANLGAVALEALRRRGELSRSYPVTAAGGQDLYHGWIELRGDAVSWAVEEGSAVWIEGRYLRPLEGNLFEAAKLADVASGVKAARRQSGRLRFMAPYGQIIRLSRSWIAESQQYDPQTGLVPWTTGDKDLDAYLADPDSAFDPDLEDGLVLAEANGDGDFGAWVALVRDGNHRTFGALLGGEERVAVRIYDNDVQELRGALSRGFNDPHDAKARDLLVKAILDTGAVPWWFERDRPPGLALPEIDRTLGIRYAGRRRSISCSR